MQDLTEQQRLFVLAFASNGGNATSAAKAAGYSDATARTQGWQLLHKPHVLAAVQDAQRQEVSGLATKAVAVLGELLDHPDGRVRIAAANSLLDRAGITAKAAEEANAVRRAKPISEMSADELAELVALQRATVSALETKMQFRGPDDAPFGASAVPKIVN
ncbi:MAG: terminase small subunit [Alphaproteobacteria bacterium]